MNPETQALATIKFFAARLPKFPDGRINFRSATEAPVLTCFVKFRDNILLLKRSHRVGDYKGKWHTVAGYLDELKPLRQKALEEVHEELGIAENEVAAVHLGTPKKFTDTTINKTFIIHPVLVELKSQPTIALDFEHTGYAWIKPEDLAKFDTVPHLDKVLKAVLPTSAPPHH